MKIVNRIKASKDFALTIKKGKSYSNYSFVVHVRPNELNYTRVGISVSSKRGNAVVRNRIKRQMRAMCDSLINYNTQALDIVVIAKHNYLSNSFDDNKKLFSELLLSQVGIQK